MTDQMDREDIASDGTGAPDRWPPVTGGRAALAPNPALDEAEIRAAIRARWTRSPDVGLSLAGEFSDAIGAALGAVHGLWETADFRPSELDRYDALLSAAGTMARRAAEAILLEAIVDALVVFAAEHPAAPRGERTNTVSRTDSASRASWR